MPLVEGTNTLTAVATNTGGTTSTASIQVTTRYDASSADGSEPLSTTYVTTNSSITVAGTVIRYLLQTQVTVNGLSVVVINGSFQANVPLALGLNTIQVTARDALGNSASTSVHVTRNH